MRLTSRANPRWGRTPRSPKTFADKLRAKAEARGSKVTETTRLKRPKAAELIRLTGHPAEAARLEAGWEPDEVFVIALTFDPSQKPPFSVSVNSPSSASDGSWLGGVLNPKE